MKPREVLETMPVSSCLLLEHCIRREVAIRDNRQKFLIAARPTDSWNYVFKEETGPEESINRNPQHYTRVTCCLASVFKHRRSNPRQTSEVLQARATCSWSYSSKERWPSETTGRKILRRDARANGCWNFVFKQEKGPIRGNLPNNRNKSLQLCSE